MASLTSTGAGKDGCGQMSLLPPQWLLPPPPPLPLPLSPPPLLLPPPPLLDSRRATRLEREGCGGSRCQPGCQWKASVISGRPVPLDGVGEDVHCNAAHGADQGSVGETAACAARWACGVSPATQTHRLRSSDAPRAVSAPARSPLPPRRAATPHPPQAPPPTARWRPLCPEDHAPSRGRLRSFLRSPPALASGRLVSEARGMRPIPTTFLP